jgi:hypothetical protein
MGPRTYGTRFRLGLRVAVDRVSFPDGGPIENAVVDDSVPVEEFLAMQYENDRRTQVRRIKAAMEQILASQSLTGSIGGAHGSLIPVQSTYVEPPFDPPSVRFDEIRKFLFNKRATLAMDSLHFEIPEHILYSYIVSAGFTDLSPTDWRAFLRLCNTMSTLFS